MESDEGKDGLDFVGPKAARAWASLSGSKSGPSRAWSLSLGCWVVRRQRHRCKNDVIFRVRSITN